jgi:hypothetical protein
MNKTLQIVLTALALVGTYCAISTTRSSVGNLPGHGAGTAVILADGSDPMPCSPNGCQNPN